MKKFIKKLGVFGCPLIALFLVVELGVRSVPNEYSKKIQGFKKQLNRIEILILGSSHALRGINPHKFNDMRAYNLAMVSQALKIDHDILFKYSDKMPNLEMVIIPISYFSLSQQDVYEGDLANRLLYYDIFYDLNYRKSMSVNPSDYSLSATLDYRNSLKMVLFKLLDNKRNIKTDSLGWMGEGGKKLNAESEFRTDGKKTATRHENGSMSFSTNINLLKKIAEFAGKNSIHLLFVCTPKTKYYVDSLNSNKIYAIDSLMNGIASGSKHVSYLNFRSSKAFDISDFRNSDHLNVKGANKLTNILANSVDTLAKKYRYKKYVIE